MQSAPEALVGGGGGLGGLEMVRSVSDSVENKEQQKEKIEQLAERMKNMIEAYLQSGTGKQEMEEITEFLNESRELIQTHVKVKNI